MLADDTAAVAFALCGDKVDPVGSSTYQDVICLVALGVTFDGWSAKTLTSTLPRIFADRAHETAKASDHRPNLYLLLQQDSSLRRASLQSAFLPKKASCICRLAVSWQLNPRVNIEA